MLRLLTQKDINVKKNDERQREIDEGKKLTRAVDSLREIKQEEDSALHKFRDETIRAIHIEIVAESTKRDELKKEVSELEDKKQEALKPLELTLAELEVIKHSLQTKEVLLDVREKNMQESEKRTHQLECDASDELARIVTLKEQVNKQMEVAEVETEKARKANKQATETLIEANGKLASVTGDIAERERKLDIREKNVEAKEKELQEREAELHKARVQKEDVKKTSERSIKRVKK